MAKRKNAAAVALGKLGGAARVPKGISMLSEEERRAIAMKGVAARIKKAGGKKKKIP
jgi:hypothetical protein